MEPFDYKKFESFVSQIDYLGEIESEVAQFEGEKRNIYRIPLIKGKKPDDEQAAMEVRSIFNKCRNGTDGETIVYCESDKAHIIPLVPSETANSFNPNKFKVV